MKQRFIRSALVSVISLFVLGLTMAKAQVIIESPQSAKEPSTQEVISTVCAARGYGKDCAQILLGMLWKESRGNSKAVGDGGRARGYYQIHYKLHDISIECAEDLVCSSQWVIDYLERNGYPETPKYAVQCHNRCGGNNGYAYNVFRHGKQLWNTELIVSNKP